MSDPAAIGTLRSQMQAKPRYRVYQQWQGNETFFCWGYLVAGPNWRASLGTAFLLLAPAGIFLGFVAPYVMREVHAIIMVFSILLPVLCGLFLFLTACRDPGIIPRQEPDEEYLAGRKPRTREVEVGNHILTIRYNDTCHFYQPPRAHHCSVNDNCIERFDHHCPWVGTTIGKRNYRTFLLFIFTATVLCLYVVGVCLAQLFLRHKELVNEDKAAGGTGDGKWGKTLRDVIPALVLMGYSFLFSFFVGGLSAFHCYLTATNQTTYENFRYNHNHQPNAFDKGVLGNCAEVWCTRIPNSQVDFRAFTDEVRKMPASLATFQAPAAVTITGRPESMQQQQQPNLQQLQQLGMAAYKHQGSGFTNYNKEPQFAQQSNYSYQPETGYNPDRPIDTGSIEMQDYRTMGGYAAQPNTAEVNNGALASDRSSMYYDLDNVPDRDPPPPQDTMQSGGSGSRSGYQTGGAPEAGTRSQGSFASRSVDNASRFSEVTEAGSVGRVSQVTDNVVVSEGSQGRLGGRRSPSPGRGLQIPSRPVGPQPQGSVGSRSVQGQTSGSRLPNPPSPGTSQGRNIGYQGTIQQAPAGARLNQGRPAAVSHQLPATGTSTSAHQQYNGR